MVDLGSSLHNERLVDVWDNTTAGNCRLDKSVKFLVAPDCKLEVAGRDALDLQVFASVSCEFKNLSCEVLEDSSCVNCRCCSNATARLDFRFK